ncbi:MAG: hypothetical protein ACQER9_00450 [Nanobdellota archaeon]
MRGLFKILIVFVLLMPFAFADYTSVFDSDVEVNGNVGIGTSNPSSKLDVRGDMNIQGVLTLRYVSGESGFESLGPNGNTHIPYSDGNVYISGNNIYFRNGSDSVKMTVEDTGNVGIGTSSPDTKLDVRGDVKVGDFRIKNNRVLQSYNQNMYFDLESGGAFNFRNGANNNIVTINNIGDIQAEGDITSSGKICDANGCIGDYMRIQDTRDSGDVLPEDFINKQAQFSFTNQIASSPNTWDSVITIKGWTDDYRAWQLLSSSDINDDTVDDSDDLYFRTGRGNSWGNLRKVWDEESDGSGSGLDSDKLDGKDASDFMDAGTDNWVDESGDSMSGDLDVSGDIKSTSLTVEGEFNLPTQAPSNPQKGDMWLE